ncbi:antiviral innate immune response receptor RIG-I isoform X2 [Hemicordylus capensis]|uniref:antiviral innate immune response receptor RIG-I isoform X2 n=1 Tax=Hemicordylus capensis TaxID=884348 RepID=UPI0023025644|nr:antiviral innate immune response receptor RIG-I isoform X2 [Hemicordylus capensis]
MTEQEKRNLLRYRAYIRKILNPAYILSYMKNWLTDEAVERIQTTGEKKGPTVAAELFIDTITELMAEGWFRGFLDALREAGYTGLYEAIENWDFKMIDSLEPHRILLKRIEPSMKNIDPDQILPFLNECLIHQELEEILQLNHNKGKGASATKLLECLGRSDKAHWPKTFQTALDRADYYCESRLWDLKEEHNNTDAEMTDVDEDSRAVEVNLHYSEEAESDNLSENACSPSEVCQRSIYVPKEARSYQTELAQPAFNGKHTIICAPTGSGKTFVSVMICDHHLRNMPAGKKGKVVFLATKVPVYEQQKKVFQEHFKRSSYTVTGICGETAANAPVAMMIEGNDITVMTPQILVNCLNDGTLSSLSLFTLMIFDECHNTVGNHPYHVLMSRYLDLKFEQAATPLPQIIGLTASLGVGSSKNLDETIEYICTLCASLNAEVISTVKENVKDLEEVVYKPQKIITLVGKRPRNCFVEVILHMMAEIEKLARELYPIDALSPIRSRSFGTQKYEQWIVDVQKRCRILQEESSICRALFVYTEHLRKYNDALIINDDARTQDALNYLKEFFENIGSGGFDDIEQQLAAKFEAKVPVLNAACQDESNENPKLEEITFILEEEYRFNPQTRTILFVKTRALVAALKNWIEESPRLRHLKPEVLMGRGKRNQNTGMTLPNQKGVLDSFKTEANSKMLIATSVADEGIDIAQCNLVLLYEYTGNVIKMIQVRGRGRAKDSKCFLVTSKSEQADNERSNILKEGMMNKAIENLQKWDEKVFMQKIDDLQKKQKRMQNSKKKEPQPKPVISDLRLLCGKCKKVACDTENIRVIEGSHHTVLGESFRTRYQTKPHNRPNRYGNFEKRNKMYCSAPNCHHDWGITVRFCTFEDLPIIKIESFSVENVATGKQLYFRKWKDVNFAIKEFDINEMTD